MTGFDDREKDFERKFAHDENLGFKAEARASKLFGLWAAAKMGLSGDAAQAYALEVVNANLEIPGFEDVLQKVAADFRAKKLEISDHIMKVELEKLFGEAKRQIMRE